MVFWGLHCLPIFTHSLQVWSAFDHNLQTSFQISDLCSDKSCLPITILLIEGNSNYLYSKFVLHIHVLIYAERMDVLKSGPLFCHFCNIQCSTMIDSSCLVTACFPDCFIFWFFFPIILNDASYFDAQHKLFLFSVRNLCH